MFKTERAISVELINNLSAIGSISRPKSDSTLYLLAMKPSTQSVMHAKFGQYLVIVCDGVGGLRGGEIASSNALKVFGHAFLSQDFARLSFIQVNKWFKEALNSAQLAIAEQAELSPEIAEMATTVALSIYVPNRSIYTFSIGDSRCYFVVNGQLVQITEDHNVINYLNASNADRKTRERYRDKLQALTAVVSREVKKPPNFHSYEHPANVAEVILSCSDGMHNFLKEKDYVFDPKLGAEMYVKKLVQTAVARHKLPKGAMSVAVYRCIDTRISASESYDDVKRREVVIKILDRVNKDRPIERMEAELITQSRINNKHLVSAYDIFRDDQYIYIVMEYVTGRELTSKIADRGSIHYRDAIFLFKQIMEGIKTLHGYSDQILHLDLKPDNIFLSADGSNAKVADFGISMILDKTGGIISSDDVPMGTAGYICPDYRRKIKPNPQFDIYALGIILFEMLTGRLPFEEDPNSAKLPINQIFEKAKKYYPPYLNQFDETIPNSLHNIIFRYEERRSEPLIVTSLKPEFEKGKLMGSFSLELENYRCALMTGIVLKVIAGFYHVHVNGTTILAKPLGQLRFRDQETMLAAGDRVELDVENDQPVATIKRMLPRTNFLRRPPAANIDNSVIIHSLANPEVS
ncbi:unnamed protein product [Didymodactylos carnosus]|uniref:Non-specific serine/threonine protein kinase n=1 Tax=Didymodactylos carnosus TaxID=1234261 RepID=A0A8S2H1M9_9BILA|nr:unnamed protein product [Didymodactylos carnosus]CAF3588645.1 unnamed protein product [Didymodactylos carnosus]